ncbi:MAG: rRNA cytosine-C5-methyltransferase [Muribaculaceae bacterium]
MNLPEKFIEQIQENIPDECDAFFDAIERPASVSIRLNKNKAVDLEPHLRRVKWCSSGYYLAERVQFTFDPAFHSGKYYVQDASSMIIQHIVSQICTAPVRYLDLCAAPGGKSSAAVDALPAGSLLVSNEIIGSRAQILKENIIKWGLPCCVVTNNDSKTIGRLTHYFDVVATDVPCSGEGMFRKEDEAVAQWSPSLVSQCVARQHEIIDNIWNALRPNGYFIYSTCTYNRAENEEMIEYICSKYAATSIDMKFPKEWNIHAGINTAHHCYRFMPHCTDGEGLFICVLHKSESEPIKSCELKIKKKAKDNKQDSKVIVPKEVKEWIITPEKCDFIVENEEIIAIRREYIDDVALLRNSLKVIYFGTHIATFKGRDTMPTQALALSTELNAKAFCVNEVNYLTAIAYLRGEAITIDADRGYCLITNESQHIGFVKNLGSRANNLYPREWRIRSGYIPTVQPRAI